MLTGLTLVVWSLAAWAVWILALVRVARTPAGRFLHGRWGKAGRLLLTVTGSLTIAGVFIPLGAVCMVIALRRSGGPEPPLGLAEPRGPQLPK